MPKPPRPQLNDLKNKSRPSKHRDISFLRRQFAGLESGQPWMLLGPVQRTQGCHCGVRVDEQSCRLRWQDRKQVPDRFLNRTRYRGQLSIVHFELNHFKKSAGPVKSILEWRGFVVISKLSYVMYLLHPILQTSFYGNHLVSPPHMGDYISTLLFLGFFMMTFFASFLFHVVVEAPLMNLEKKLLSWNKFLFF